MGHAVYVFEYGGVHWHHVYIAEELRGRGLARRAYKAMVDDARTNWTKGKPFEIEAHRKSPEGELLLLALGFQQVGGVVYSRHEP